MSVETDRNHEGIRMHLSNGVFRCLPKVIITRSVGAVALLAAAAKPTLATAPLYVNDNDTIREFSSSGASLGTFGDSSSVFSGSSLVLDKIGNLYVGSYSTINKFGPAGNNLGTFATAGGNDEPGGMAFDSSGNLYVAYGNNGGPVGNISEYSAAGSFLRTIATGLNDPESLAFDSHGNLYVNFYTTGNIEEYSASGADLGSFATLVSGGSGNRAGIAFDSFGDLYAPTGANVEKLSPTGVELYTLPSHINYAIEGIAINSSDDVFWVQGQSIYENSPTGADLGAFASGLQSPGALAFAVPEPGSLSLLTIGGLSLLARRRKFKRVVSL